MAAEPVTYESDRLEGAPHPRDTARLFGHAAAEAAFLEAYRSDHLAHAWLIGGPRGIGKATLAWRFARFLLAHPDPASPAVVHAVDLGVPESHPVWARFRSRAPTDVAVLRRRWNEKDKKPRTVIQVDDVREMMGLFQRSAGGGGHRICIIDSADDLNASSANALLKVIEEPPRRALFLIVAHQPAQVLPTIRSRCRKLLLAGLGEADVRQALAAARASQGEAPDAALEDAAMRSGGSVGEAIRLLSGTRLDLDREFRTALDRLPAVDWKALHALADRLNALERSAATDLLAVAVLEWLDRCAHAAAQKPVPPARLAPLAEVWDKVGAAVRETEALNLDVRPLLLSVFADLAQMLRVTGLGDMSRPVSGADGPV